MTDRQNRAIPGRQLPGAGAPQRDPAEQGGWESQDSPARWSGVLTSSFWVVLWLVWLIEPWLAAWPLRHTPSGVLALVGTVAFGLVYAGDVLLVLLAGARGRGRPKQWIAVLLWMMLAVLAVLVVQALGQDASAMVVFLGIAAMWTWRLRPAILIAALVWLALAWAMWNLQGWHHNAGTLVGMAFGVVAAGIGGVSGRRRRELSAARALNAKLELQQQRTQFSRDLHDIVGHSLTVISIKAELASRLAEVDPHRAQQEMAAVEQLSRDALADVQRAVEGYRELSLAGELVHAREVLRDAGITAVLPGSTEEVSGDLRDLFAWTIREAVTNVVRHARASTCEVRLSATSVVIQDDGRGPAQNTAGRGLLGLRDRARDAGAVLTTGEAPGGGYRLAVLVPASSGLHHDEPGGAR
ncbi:sensor histidine kinase [Dermacoccaceae bacterium W4C1]